MGAAIRNAVFLVIIHENLCKIKYFLWNLCNIYSKMCTFAADFGNLVAESRHDARESGESPGQYLLL
jgi:hypothetical protein